MNPAALAAAALLLAAADWAVAGASSANAAGRRPVVPPAVANSAGTWRIYASGGVSCELRLTTRKVAAGYALEQPHRCPDVFPLQSASAWKPYGDLIVMTSETGAPVLTFQEPEDGVRVSNGDPAYSLKPVGAAIPPRRKR